MLVYKTQIRLVDASASIWRAYLRAAGETLASSGRGWSLWLAMLAAASARHAPTAATHWLAPRSLDNGLVPAHGGWLTCGAPGAGWVPMAPMWWVGPGWMFWAPCASGRAWTNSAACPSSPTPVPAASKAPAGGRLAPDAIFARYRSVGGHAAAQVIVPAIDTRAQVMAKATLSPVDAMLGIWRAALGASS